MGSPFDCIPCAPGAYPNQNTVNIPGPQGDPGEPGEAGEDGTDGKNAFSTVISESGVLLPLQGNNTSAIQYDDVEWMQVGQNVIMAGFDSVTGNPVVANFKVVSKNTTTNTAVFTFLEYNGDHPSGNTIIVGAGVSPSGIQSVIPPEDLFVSAYESAQFAIAAGSILNLAHSLNGQPEVMNAVLVSQDGSEGGYSAGDEVDAAFTYHYENGAEARGSVFSWGSSNTNVWVAYSLGINDYDGPRMCQKTGGSIFTPTFTDDTKWKLKVVAVKLNTP